MKRRFIVVFILVMAVILAFSGISGAASPGDALSAKPANSMYVCANLSNLNGVLNTIFSAENLEAFGLIQNTNFNTGMSVAAMLVTQIPVKSASLIAGFDESPFFQAALSLPDTYADRLKKISSGEGTAGDISTLLLGNSSGAMFADMLSVTAEKSDDGSYYVINNAVYAAAEGDLLLFSMTPDGLAESRKALKGQTPRFTPKRRFSAPDYVFFHFDPQITLAASKMANEGDGDENSEETDNNFLAMFKAPMEIEESFELKSDGLLVSIGMNSLECMADTKVMEKFKATPGASLFLAGGGRPFLALSGVTSFNPEAFKTTPQAAVFWDGILKNLSALNITEDDLVNLLDGTLSLVAGNEAVAMGSSLPGFYLAAKGRDGAAGNILSKLRSNEALGGDAMFKPISAEGWEQLYSVMPDAIPASVVVGIKSGFLFAGLADPQSLAMNPQLPDKAAGLMKENLFSAGFVDSAGLWGMLREMAADPESLLGMGLSVLGDEKKIAAVRELFNAELGVDFFEVRSPSIEEAFFEFHTIQVPADKKLLPRIASLINEFAFQPAAAQNDEEKSE